MAARASRSWKTTAIVLKKTKLKEKDLILTLLDDRGEQVRAVAKSAQKPGSAFSARLEVFSVVELMLYEGKNLQTVTDVRTVATNEACRSDLTRLSYGAAMTELVEKTALEGQEMPVTFALTSTALESLGRAEEGALPFVTAAFLIKLIAYLGYRPSFDDCTMCGRPRSGQGFADDDGCDGSDLANGTGVYGRRSWDDGTGETGEAGEAGEGGAISEEPAGPVDGEGVFSVSSGGWVCGDCAAAAELGYDDFVDSNVAAWVKTLMSLRFVEIEKMFGPDAEGSAGLDALAGELLDFCERWIGEHLGIRMRSIGYLSRLNI